ncbi:MAG: hypothetical protein GYB30_03225 [Gammaproteobacteria bacterium]|nr:hypothetical protein [Gammaproteobacteria bacterium]
MFANYQNDFCQFQLCHERAQILRWQPKGQADVLWCADKKFLSLDKPLRGGIPVCWPWFGAGRGENSRKQPFHGFARSATWRQVAFVASAQQPHIIEFELNHHDLTDEHRAVFDYKFCVRLRYEIGETLHVQLRVVHAPNLPVFGALHTYFNVGDSEQVRLFGLESSNIDAAVSINGPTEVLYSNPAPILRIEDAANSRSIVVKQQGHHDVMLWSPWKVAGHTLSDTLPDDYRYFVCAETAAISAPMAHELSAEISVQPN